MAREMKDSGVEWIGKIPIAWQTIRFKYLHNGLNTGESIDKNYWSLEDSDSVFYTAGQLPIKTSFKDFPSWKYTGRTDLLLSRNGTPYVYYPVEDACYSDHIIRAKIKEGINRKYVQYALQRSVLSMVVDSVSLATWSASLWNELVIPWPSESEQTQIATFLDSACSRIDSVIEQTRASIEEYKKLKQAVITQAVTKGIRPNREMKDSGIEWIGEIPAKWEVLSFTKSLRSIVDYRGKTPEKQDEGTLLVTARNIKDGKIDYEISKEYVRTEDFDEIMHRGKVEIGDVLFTTEAPLGAVANADRTDFALAQRIIKFQGHTEQLNNYYLKYWIMSNTFQQNLATFSTGSTAKGIKASKLGMLKQILPPLQEQEEIVEYLNEKTGNIDKLMMKKDDLLSELESYKKSLIFEYVTGKKEVPA